MFAHSLAGTWSHIAGSLDNWLETSTDPGLGFRLCAGARGVGAIGVGMIVRGDVIKVRDLRRWAASVLVALALLRALIPPGFMPDFNSATLGDFKLVICTSSGLHVLDTGSGNASPDAPQDKPESQPAGHDQPCAFAIVFADAGRIQDFTVLKPSFAVSRPVLPPQINLPPARAGPALGSRAPPILS